jgi:hypothetical protein
MSAASRPLVLLLAAAVALSPAFGEAKRHGHGHGHRHGGWMHARIATVRGWFRHVADSDRGATEPASRRSHRSADMREVESAALSARRRSEVEAYLRDHPAFAAAQ